MKHRFPGKFNEKLNGIWGNKAIFDLVLSNKYLAVIILNLELKLLNEKI